jgi:glycosyltransferase involved in cell wall biosynthesis
MMDDRMAILNSPMIYIDASRYSNTAKRTGVENYSYYLIIELVKKYKKEITLITPRRIDLDVKQLIIPFPRLWTLLRLSWEILSNSKIDNLFVPSHLLPLIHPKNCTITIHDVVFKYSPESYGFLSRLYLNWGTKFAVKHATKIITPSNATKKDLIKFYQADSKKISVVPLGFTPVKVQASNPKVTLKKFGLKSGKYFLYLGRIEYKKNSDTLLRAFENFAQTNKEFKLVLAGFLGHGGQEIVRKIPHKLKKQIVLTGYVHEAEKTALLKNAHSFVFPSRFEGFGIPLLEAMHANLPIIASDIPSSREVAGNKIHYFDKENAEMLAKMMKKLAKSGNLSLNLDKSYKKMLQGHSWSKCAEGVYRIIAG